MDCAPFVMCHGQVAPRPEGRPQSCLGLATHATLSPSCLDAACRQGHLAGEGGGSCPLQRFPVCTIVACCMLSSIHLVRRASSLREANMPELSLGPEAALAAGMLCCGLAAALADTSNMSPWAQWCQAKSCAEVCSTSVQI